jgi:hypothetical protein
MRYVPQLSDLAKKQFENQYSLPPADPHLNGKQRAIFITGVEAAGPWTLRVHTARGTEDTREGVGSREFFWPVYAATIVATTGIDRLSGFTIERSP